MHPRWLPLIASIVALSGCNLVAYDILAAGRDLTSVDGGSSIDQGDGGSGEDGGTDVDPCAAFNGGCDARATCERDGSKAICHCPEGSRANGKQCEDVNECLAADRGGCDKNANCINDPGTSHCQCKTGFDGDGKTCTDVDECTTSNGGCDPHATCTNTSGSRTCECTLGYGGDGVTCTRTPWPKVAQLPTPTAGSGAAIWRDRLYVVGGAGISSGADQVWMSEIKVDGGLGTFVPQTGPATVLQDHCVVATNDTLYAIGGSDYLVRGDVYFASIAADGTLGTWSTTTALPSARTSLSCYAVGGRIYVFGGGTVSGGYRELTDVLVATVEPGGGLSSWQSLTDLPTPLITFGVALIGDRFFVFGGTWVNADPGSVYSVPLMGDGTLGAWSAAIPVELQYKKAPLVGWNQQLHLGAGQLVADVDPLGVVSAWRPFATEIPTALQRAHHASVVHQGHAFLIAGTAKSGQSFDDVRMELLP